MHTPYTFALRFNPFEKIWYTQTMITIITGDQGAGKTTFLARNIERIKKHGSIGGILTPAVYKLPVFEKQSKNIKTGFDALDISTGRRWPLGRMDETLGGPVFGPYSFSLEGFSRAANAFKAALAREDPFIFLDEIGPLELEKHEGFYELLPLLSQIPEKCRLSVVIRPSLLKRALAEIFPGQKTEIFEITTENRKTAIL